MTQTAKKEGKKENERKKRKIEIRPWNPELLIPTNENPLEQDAKETPRICPKPLEPRI